MKFSQWLETAQNVPDARNFTYLGCVLTETSQKHLFGLAQRLYQSQMNTLIPKNWKCQSHHMTAKFKPLLEDMRVYNNYFDKTIELKITGFAVDENCIAVTVTPEPYLPVANERAHVTVAHSPNVRPVYSNTLLAKSKILPATGELSSIFLAIQQRQDQITVWPPTGVPLARTDGCF